MQAPTGRAESWAPQQRHVCRSAGFQAAQMGIVSDVSDPPGSGAPRRPQARVVMTYTEDGPGDATPTPAAGGSKTLKINVDLMLVRGRC